MLKEPFVNGVVSKRDRLFFCMPQQFVKQGSSYQMFPPVGKMLGPRYKIEMVSRSFAGWYMQKLGINLPGVK